VDVSRKARLVIAAGVLANLCQGAAYSFSVFKGPLKAHLGCSETQVALAFSLAIGFLPVGMLLSGRFADRGSPRTVVAIGGLLFGSGMFLAGFSHSTTWLYATFGLMMSLGNGAAYGAVVATAVKWYPHRRGMAGGIVVSALGLGTIVIAPVAQQMIDMPALGVLGAFKVLGAAFIVITVGASFFIVNPPSGYGAVEKADSHTGEAAEDLDWRRMLARGRFWLLYVIYVAGAFSGLMVVSQASSIAQELTGLGASTASLIVGVLGLANATGRLSWGTVSDRIGRFPTLSLMFAITAVVMFGFSTLAGSSGGLIAAILLVGLCYGGYLGTFPSICADTFGSRNLTVNYGLLFSAFSLSGVLGPRVGAVLKESTGGYTTSFAVACGVAVFGLVLCLAAGLADKRRSSS
jgi:OFA family oxalate/formate antiporter-like MFS transporter